MVIGFFKCSQGREEEHGSLLFLFYLGFILKVLSGIWLYVYSQGRVGNLAQFFSFSMLIQRFNVKELSRIRIIFCSKGIVANLASRKRGIVFLWTRNSGNQEEEKTGLPSFTLTLFSIYCTWYKMSNIENACIFVDMTYTFVCTDIWRMLKKWAFQHLLYSVYCIAALALSWIL